VSEEAEIIKETSGISNIANISAAITPQINRESTGTADQRKHNNPNLETIENFVDKVERFTKEIDF